MENKIVNPLCVSEGLFKSIVIVALCWFVVFSPWTGEWINFWASLSCASIAISMLAGHFRPEWTLDVVIGKKTILSGCLLAVLLWGFCWLGGWWAGEYCQPLRAEIDAIYELKGGYDPYLLAILVFTLMGQSEEIFWRGYIQRILSNRWNSMIGYVATTLLATIVYIWSFNWALLVGALLLNAVAGGLYSFNPRWFTPIMLAHTLFDVLVFVVLPI